MEQLKGFCSSPLSTDFKGDIRVNLYWNSVGKRCKLVHKALCCRRKRHAMYFEVVCLLAKAEALMLIMQDACDKILHQYAADLKHRNKRDQMTSKTFKCLL